MSFRVALHECAKTKQDETEARVVHRTLCELVERQDPALLGGDLSQVGRDT